MKILTLSILLVSSAASAQLAPIVPSFPGASNPIVILPKSLPNPLSGPYAGTPVRLPSPSVVPALPAVAAPAAVRPVAPAAASAAPAERSEEPETKDGQDAQKGRLDRLFDGGARPVRTPAASGRRIDIPERELERELGL